MIDLKLVFVYSFTSNFQIKTTGELSFMLWVSTDPFLAKNSYYQAYYTKGLNVT